MEKNPSNDTLLELNALYKNYSEGDVPVEPSINPFDFVGKATLAARDELKATPKNLAPQEYINIVAKLKG